MLQELKEMTNYTYTENGALTLASSMSACLDLFGTAGALRKAEEEVIIQRFMDAYRENPDTAMKILFFSRDIRGGLGERRIFRTILRYMADKRTESVLKNLAYVPEYGRYDDLLALMDTKCEAEALNLIRRQLAVDVEALKSGNPVSLLGKWLPSVNTSNKEQAALGKKIAKFCGMNDAKYRKTLSALRREIRIIENNLREMDYSFDYEKQTSKALLKYRTAFMRNDRKRYVSYLDAVAAGTAKMNTGNIYPYELVEPFIPELMGMGWKNTVKINSLTEEERKAVNTTWDALPDFFGDDRALAVVDGSGSMYSCTAPSPAAVALSLGIYFAERAKGEFKNHFITFSAKPQLVELKGDNLIEKLEDIVRYNEAANTDIQAVFRLILKTAKTYKIPQEEMPKKLIIISDMEFDFCAENAEVTNFWHAKKMYKAAGYKLPQIVFWNVSSRNRQQPVRFNDQGAALVSGCSPRVFEMVAGELTTPYKVMMNVLGSERYAKIAA